MRPGAAELTTRRIRADRWTLAALLVGALLRLGVVVVSPWTPTGGDADAYLLVGSWIRVHGDMPQERGLPAVLPPLYPLVIALAGIAGERAGILLLKLLNVAAGLLTIHLAGRLGRALSGCRLGRLSAWLAALHPMFVLYVGDVATEGLFHPLLLGSLLLLNMLLNTGKPRVALAYGALLGVSALLRPAGLGSGALALVAGLLVARAIPWRRRALLSMAAGVATVLTILPWSLYASSRFGEPILLTDTAGFNFWDGHHPLNHRISLLTEQRERDTLAARKDDERRAIVAWCAEQGCTRRERASRFYEDAWRRMDEGGASFAWHTWANLRGLWKVAPDPVAHGRLRSLMLAGFLLPLTLAGLFGLARALSGPRTRPLGFAALTSLLLFTATAAWFVGTFRYRFGHVDPILVAFAPCCLRGRVALRWLRARRGRSAGKTPL